MSASVAACAIWAPYSVHVFPFKDENPTSGRSVVTIALIVINLVIFFGPQSMNNPQTTEVDMVMEWAAIPCEVMTGDGLTSNEIELTFGGNDQACDVDANGAEAFPDKPVRIASFFSMFMHGGIMHLLGNMWFLWLFGNNIEDRLGPVKYLVFYLAAGIAAMVAHVAVQPDSTIPVVGASGAVAGIMGAYAVWFPNAPIRTFVFIVLWNIKAKWWLGFWLISQFFTGADSQVAWMAHVGGFVFGAIVALFVRGTPAAQRSVLHTDLRRDQWDSTGGAGEGPYPRPHRIVSG